MSYRSCSLTYHVCIQPEARHLNRHGPPHPNQSGTTQWRPSALNGLARWVNIAFRVFLNHIRLELTCSPNKSTRSTGSEASSVLSSLSCNSSVSISDMSRPARTLSCDTLGPRPLTFAQDRLQSAEHGGPEVAVHGLDYFLFRTLTLSHFPVIMFFSSSVETAAARILGLASHLDRSRPQHWEPNGSHPNPDGQTTSTWNGNFSQDGHHHHPYHHARWDPNGISWPQHEGHGPSSRGGMHELKSFHLFHVDRLLLR
jgi:hypothetical protein